MIDINFEVVWFIRLYQRFRRDLNSVGCLMLFLSQLVTDNEVEYDENISLLEKYISMQQVSYL